jgi:hypothetical protein
MRQHLSYGDWEGAILALERWVAQAAKLAKDATPVAQLHARAKYLAEEAKKKGPTNPGPLAVPDEFWDVLNTLALLLIQVCWGWLA